MIEASSADALPRVTVSPIHPGAASVMHHLDSSSPTVLNQSALGHIRIEKAANLKINQIG